MDGAARRVSPGDVISIPAGAKHTIHAFDTLRVMEIQLGRDIRVSDKIKHARPAGWEADL